MAKVTANIYALDTSEPVICVLVDLAKAFDTVSQAKLIECLENIGFRVSALKFLQSYLGNRQQVCQY